GLPNPASSISTTSTFGAPSGGFTCPICSQPGSEPPSVSFATPLNAGRRIGSLVRSIVSSLIGAHLGRVCWLPVVLRGRDRGVGLPLAQEAICQLGRERPRPLEVVRLEIGRGDFRPR